MEVCARLTLVGVETEIETFAPETINEKLIIEKVDEFLKEMINWEVPSLKNKVGF